MQPNQEQVEVVIVGAGPIGIELGVALKRAEVSTLQFDANQIGHTFTWWPRNTRFFSTSEKIAIAGFPIQTQDQEHITGEAYLAYLRSIVEMEDLPIWTYEPVVHIQKEAGGFRVQTEKQLQTNTYHSQAVVLAVGDMHRPRRLDIPGEDLAHVSHYFTDPHRYFRKELLIVGGRNSAVEAALRCFRAGVRVSLSYRRSSLQEEFIKPHLLPDILTQIDAGNINFYPQSTLARIEPGMVELTYPAKSEPARTARVQADFVLLCTGYEADQSLMKNAGVLLSGENHVPEYNPETMETNISGLFVAGTAAAGRQSRYTVFIENAHQHVGLIVQALTGNWPAGLGTVPSRQYDLSFEDYKRN
ncbi:MAG: NAD(P)-binding domain-containing protein [Anaerolineales bacterium]|nr:NAD(P)-binding domain-containing protein [Anaerolineales bacterium]